MRGSTKQIEPPAKPLGLLAFAHPDKKKTARHFLEPPDRHGPRLPQKAASTSATKWASAATEGAAGLRPPPAPSKQRRKAGVGGEVEAQAPEAMAAAGAPPPPQEPPPDADAAAGRAAYPEDGDSAAAMAAVAAAQRIAATGEGLPSEKAAAAKVGDRPDRRSRTQRGWMQIGAGCGSRNPFSSHFSRSSFRM
jgi:hypothetical protein